MLKGICRKVIQLKRPWVVSIPTEPADDGLQEWCEEMGWTVVRAVAKSQPYDLGSVVLAWVQGDQGRALPMRVVRVTADCPFVDFSFLPQLEGLVDRGAPVAATRTDLFPERGGLPAGFDLECFPFTPGLDVLKAWEQPCTAILEPPILVASGFSVTVDWWHDLEWARKVYDCAGEKYEHIVQWWNRYRLRHS